MEQQQIIQSVERWLESVVVGLNLCPFAGVPLARGAVRFAVTQADTVELLLHQLVAELELLDKNPDIETTLLIHPQVLTDFHDYNQFLTLAENLLAGLDYEGVYQIASFHPQYQFAGTCVDDAENFSNRSPFPLLHLIREQSLESAIAAYPDPEQIPQRNIELLTGLGKARLEQMLLACLAKEDQ